MSEAKVRIVVKISSKVLSHSDGSHNFEALERLVGEMRQLAADKDLSFIVVSSGAVRIGRSLAPKGFQVTPVPGIDTNRKTLEEQVFAAIGQPQLMQSYIAAFGKDGGPRCAQILVTRYDFSDRRSYISLKAVTENLLRANVVPIFNENDVLAPEATSDIGDNDQLAALVGSMVGAEKIILLSDVDGFYTAHPDLPGAERVARIENVADYLSMIDDSQSTGKGGMLSKLATADLVMSLGMDLQIAGGSHPRILTEVLNDQPVGTLFPRKRLKPASSFKRWLATAAISSGHIEVSTTLADMLRNRRVTSVLMTGIESVSGEFPAQAIIGVFDDCGLQLGLGRTKFSSAEIRDKIEERLHRPSAESMLKGEEVIHYDYFAFADDAIRRGKPKAQG